MTRRKQKKDGKKIYIHISRRETTNNIRINKELLKWEMHISNFLIASEAPGKSSVRRALQAKRFSRVQRYEVLV